MKTVGIVFVVLLLSTPAVHGGSAALGQASKHGGGPSASSKGGGLGPGGGPSASSKGGGLGPGGGYVSKSGGPSASNKAGKQGPADGKGSSAINGTRIGARH